jgi:hypothetical protein
MNALEKHEFRKRVQNTIRYWEEYKRKRERLKEVLRIHAQYTKIKTPW